MEGGCACRTIRYRLANTPLFTHGCHCTWCQRETGSAFAVNALIETACVQVLAGQPEPVNTPSNSGQGQVIVRCPKCRIALWSHYSGGGPKFAFIRVGTLDQPHGVNPDIHIFTTTKRPWVILPEGVPAVPEYYDREKFWPADALKRRAAALA